ncbi:CWF19-like protein 1 [Ciona intestinalis]
MSLKILVCGDVSGKLDALYGRVKRLQSKGNNFELLLCVGEFFGGKDEDQVLWKEYLEGRKKSPISTFILGPNDETTESYFDDSADDGAELCENITHLGKKGIFTGTSGLKIAYVSGTQSTGTSTKTSFSDDDIRGLASQLGVGGSEYHGVDILMTSSWPNGVSAFGNSPSSEKCKSCGSAAIAELAKSSKPRYHFAGLEGVNYERVPYRNHTVLAEPSRHVTRFIALSSVGNPNKEKYLYAFSITPMSLMTQQELNSQPPEATESPYTTGNQTKNIPVLVSGQVAEQYRWNMDTTRAPKRKSQNNPNQPERKHARPQDWSCWFCLGGDKVEKHLVASVGELCYVAMAKGGLTSDHALILPIAHHSSSNELPDDTRVEVLKYMEALRTAYKSVGRECVFFERNYRTDHMQIQVVPLPPGVTSSQVKESFVNLGTSNTDRHGNPNPIDFVELPQRTDLKQIIGRGIPFFHVELPDGTRLVHKIQRYFPLQFGREALCSAPLLNSPKRIDWRSCALSCDQETDLTKKFRKFFKKFDFSLDEE